MFTDKLALISVSINFSVQSKLAATYIRSGGGAAEFTRWVEEAN